jgi:hypothetical protein
MSHGGYSLALCVPHLNETSKVLETGRAGTLFAEKVFGLPTVMSHLLGVIFLF